MIDGLRGEAVWSMMVSLPGVGVTIADRDGKILFANKAALQLFLGRTDVDITGRYLAELHPTEYVDERLRVIREVMESQRPRLLRHIFLGRNIESTVWPIKDESPPHDRVLAISRQISVPDKTMEHDFDVFTTEYIDLGPLSVLTQRELEVLVMLGHGLSVPQVALALHRSPKTIERHKDAIGKKLRVQTQAAMVRIVTAMGLTMDHVDRKRMSSHPIEKSAAPLPVRDIAVPQATNAVVEES